MNTKKQLPVIEEAWITIDKIFKAYGNCEPVKEGLWEMLKRALVCEQDAPTALERANMIYCFEQVKQVLEAAYVLHSSTDRVNCRLAK